MDNKDRQVKNTFWYLIPLTVGNLIPFVSLTIFTRVLTPEDYGVLALARIYAILASGLANFGLAIIYERNFFQVSEEREKKALLVSLMGFVILFSIGLVAVTFLAKGWLAVKVIGDARFADVLFWSLVVYCLSEIKLYYLFTFKNRENARGYALSVVVESVLTLIFSFLFVVVWKKGVIGLVWGQLCGVSLVYLYLTFFRFKPSPSLFRISVLWDSVKISWPLIPRILFKTIDTQFDKYMIGLLASIGGAGVYGVGQRFSNIVLGFMDAISGVFRPHVYQRMFDEGEKGGDAIGSYLSPFFYVIYSIVLMIVLFSEEAFFVMTPAEYHAGINIAIILSLFYATMFFEMQPQLLYAKKSGLITGISIFAMLVNVGLNIPFIQAWGALGAACATLLAGFISGGVKFFFYQKHYRIGWEYGKILPVFFSLMLVGAGMVFLREIGASYPSRLALKAAAVVFFALWGVRIQVLTKKNLIFVRDIIARRFGLPGPAVN